LVGGFLVGGFLFCFCATGLVGACFLSLAFAATFFPEAFASVLLFADFTRAAWGTVGFLTARLGAGNSVVAIRFAGLGFAFSAGDGGDATAAAVLLLSTVVAD
jgi:hypothetical protein